MPPSHRYLSPAFPVPESPRRSSLRSSRAPHEWPPPQAGNNGSSPEALDGLPPVKVHCSLLAEEAIHAALWDYAEKNGIQIEGLEKPKSDIHEDEEEEEY